MTVRRAVRTALVIGGGIAGPVVAMALEKAGVGSTVYEGRATGSGGIGSFLTLGSNGVDALRAIDADGPALSVGFPTPRITLRSGTGKRLGEAPTGLVLPDGTTSQTLKRAELYRALHETAASRGVRIEHGKRLVEAEETSAGVRAIFDDGSEAVGDVLIGADGIHSTVRRIIDPDAPAPVYSGLITTGGYADGVAVDIEPGSYEMIFGRRGFFGYALARDEQVWWFANVPRPSEPARGEVEGLSGEDWRLRLRKLYELDAGPAVRLIEASPQIATMSPIHTVPRLRTWHTARMILIGDAAHAPSPTSGQGASLSIEDAVVLAQCLRDLPEPASAFARFEAVRRPRAERIVKAAARINNSKAAGPVARVFRDAMLPKILPRTANSSTFQETYRHHIDWDAPVPATTADR